MSTVAGMENFTNGYNYVFSLSTNQYNSGSSGSSLSNKTFGSNGTNWGASFGNNNNAGTIQGNTLFKMVKGSLTSSTVLVESRNSSLTLTSASTANTIGLLRYDRFIFGGRWNTSIESSNGNYGVGFHGTQIFHCFFDIDVNFTSFESLFKSTIGKGITLP
jgi:hypothetical protein